MPRGFLVKRSKKAGPVSYRVREENESAPNVDARVEAQHHSGFVQRPSVRLCFGGQPESFFSPSLSPTRPDSECYSSQFPSADFRTPRADGSQTQTDLFEPVLGGFAVNGSPVSPSLPEMATKLDLTCADRVPCGTKRQAEAPNSKSIQPASKKRKPPAAQSPQDRKASVRDQVTTSPVLGLRIKEISSEDAKQVATTCSSLGEFICQLCKQRYSDPLSLAHHRCSRIVRVEYRCTECDKTFSCPANLASHRRWHKPKGDESQPSASGAPHSDHCDSGSDEDAPFRCSQCAKKFRRLAYLRKHLALHERKKAGLRQDPNPGGPQERGSEVGKDVSAELSAKQPQSPCAAITADTFQCRFCGENFFSSPGLTRHINKQHPTESRHMILLTNSI